MFLILKKILSRKIMYSIAWLQCSFETLETKFDYALRPLQQLFFSSLWRECRIFSTWPPTQSCFGALIQHGNWHWRHILRSCAIQVDLARKYWGDEAAGSGPTEIVKTPGGKSMSRADNRRQPNSRCILAGDSQHIRCRERPAIGAGTFSKVINVDTGQYVAVKELSCIDSPRRVFIGKQPNIIEYLSSDGWGGPCFKLIMTFKEGNLQTLTRYSKHWTI